MEGRFADKCAQKSSFHHAAPWIALAWRSQRVVLACRMGHNSSAGLRRGLGMVLIGHVFLTLNLGKRVERTGLL